MIQPRTNSKQIGYYLRPSKQLVQLPVVVNSFNKLLTPGSRVYMPSNPIINNSIVIGINAFNVQAGNISTEVSNPNGANVGALGLSEFLLVTFCNAKGEELIKNIPYNALQTFSSLRKYLPTYLNICTQRSYFSVTNAAPVLSATQVANINYFLMPLQ